MTSILHSNGKNEIYNSAGMQCPGSMTPGQEGLSPRELLEASLGLCVTNTFLKLLERDGITCGPGLKIEVTAKKHEDGENRFDNFDVHVSFPDNYDTVSRKKALVIIERACTIGNTLKTGAVVNLIDITK